jgi:peptidoglycan/LPS O-acetylase OafA/YrhL
VTRESTAASARWAAIVIAAVAGALGWVLPTAISGRAEAWDSPLYWMLGMPITCAGAGLAGYLSPGSVRKLGLIAMAAQAIAMFVPRGLGNLFPVGLAAMLVLAGVVTIFAWIGGRVRGRLAPA